MSQTFLSPDRLYDRHWRPGHPFRRNPSAKRRWTMLLLFAFLCGLIGGYLYITDPSRVKLLAESELTRLIGGHVTVGKAKLSLFEGLRLEYVNVYVDRSGADDSLLFSANQFFVDYDAKALLAGKLRLTRIAAIDPTVQLIENLDTGKWNYQRMRRGGGGSGGGGRAGQPMPALPQVILRNAQIEYAETIGGQPVSAGTMAIEGQLAPSSDGQRYTFELQSRGGSVATHAGSIGPTVQGTLRRDTGEVTASLRDFKFGQDVRSMLPAQVRAWWDRHNLAGAVDVPVLAYTPSHGEGTDATESKFRVETLFRQVNLTVRPEEWMSRDEIIVQDWAQDAFEAMREAGLNANGVVDRLASLSAPSPIRLDQVQGNFVFTEDGIVLRNVEGQLEENRFSIDGRIDGYSPLSQAKIEIKSTQTKIPAQPQYITSMPLPVRELYGHLRPSGICTLQVRLERPTFGSRLEFAGAVKIVDGNFIFDRFPYPVRAATGEIVFGYDTSTGYETVKLVGLRGKGVKGGPNENAIINLSGLIGPLTSDVGVFIKVSADGVQDEPTLRAAFPPEVLKAMENLDADGKGEYPKFRGGFECRVNRPIGPRSPWLVETDVELKNASGKMVAFPYMMENVTGKLAIREGYVDIINATMKKPNDASLVIDGRVTWRAGAGGRPLEPGEVINKVTPARPDLKVTARNVPIDKDLLAALPDDRRAWLTKVGLTGMLDIDGRVWVPSANERDAVAKSSTSSELTHAFDLTLRNGTIWPAEGTFSISNLAGNLQLLPDRLKISQMSAKRGVADLTGRGELRWPQNNPSVFISGTASRLELDRDLYRVLPAPAQVAWDAIHPEGSVDLDLTYNGAVGGGAGAGAGATTRLLATTQLATTQTLPPATPTTQPTESLASSRPSPPLNNLELIISPVKLAATIKPVPYRLSDITGTVRLNHGKVTLTDVTGKHGDGKIRVSGSGLADKTDWNLRLSAEKITVDEEFISALPTGLQTVIDGLKVAGVVNFDFPKLTIRETPPGQRLPPVPPTPASIAAAAAAAKRRGAAASASTTEAESTPLDVDFSVRLGMTDSALDVGVPMTHVGGRMALEGTVRSSRLADLTGAIDLPSLQMADRAASDVHAEFFKPASKQGLHIGNITGRLAGGKISGNVNLTFPDEGASRYVMELVLRDADIRQLSGEMTQDLSGQLSASLNLQGDWSDTKSRRGRGEVNVSGKEMYKIPLVLGLLQITNLSLPITAPFNQGEARYMVDGQILTVEALTLRSRDMLMSGSGQLDFAKKKVAMTFTTDNPNWPKLPIVGDIIHTAKNELLQIHIKGTLQEPKVSATAANTVTTTVDEVMRGDGK